VVECQLPKLDVAGSSPVSRFTPGALSSVGSERLPYKQEVTGSNPVAPTTKAILFQGWLFYLYIKTGSERPDFTSGMSHPEEIGRSPVRIHRLNLNIRI
jgi:hypothetical protein